MSILSTFIFIKILFRYLNTNVLTLLPNSLFFNNQIFTNSYYLFYLQYWHFLTFFCLFANYSRYIPSLLWFVLTQLERVWVNLAALTIEWRSLTPFFGSYSCFWPFFCWLYRLLFSRMTVNLTQYSETVGIFNDPHFAHKLRHKILLLLSIPQDNVFSHFFVVFL